jgi:Protein ChrB, N-terminal
MCYIGYSRSRLGWRQVPTQWIILSYSLPAEPSSKRVLVWRHLRKLGAILDSGIWMLPRTPALETSFGAALEEIRSLGGHPLAFYADSFDSGQDNALKAIFNDTRGREYSELLQRCQRFLSHVQRLTEAREFKFDAVEELEEDLEKRRRSLAQIVSRDAFEIAERRQVEDCIKDCAAALASFIEQAFLAEDD